MNKLEKLTQVTGVESSNVASGKVGLCDFESATKMAALLNDLIDHITALESEVDRLKGREVKYDTVTSIDFTPTPPTMETDKQ